MKFKEQLEDLNACEEAVEWVGDRDLKTAWEECVRGDWMLWLAARLKVDSKLVALAACDCAETSLNFVLADEGRPAAALRIARAWCAGEVTLDEVKVAASDANAAASYAASYAADAAACAAAACAAYAADAAYAAARRLSLARSADIVRKRISAEILLEEVKDE